MANVNCYPVSNVMKTDQMVNSQNIQKILDENVGLIHAIIEKQQQNQEAEDLLKSLHKNLIYLATIADQTTSAGNTANQGANTQHQYNYPQTTITHQNQPNPSFPSNVTPQPTQPHPYQSQPSVVVAHTAPIETIDKKPQSSLEDVYKDSNVKSSESMSSMNVDIDREIEKCHTIREPPIQPIVTSTHKNVDIDKETPIAISQTSDIPKEVLSSQTVANSEYIPKYDENVTSSGSHMPNSNVKTDMPPPSQPIGIHQDKNPMSQQSQQPPSQQQQQQQQQYSSNQRIMYPGMAPNYNQYNPHFDQNSKFYPPQNMYQQSPYNYQGMYNPYQPVASPVVPPTHYNQHMMNTSLYPQYPYYQQPGLEHLPPSAVPKESSMPQQMQHAGNPMNQPMYPPNTTVPQSMYPSANQMPPQSMHPPPNTMSQSIKPPNSESLSLSQTSQSLQQTNSNISE